MSVEPLIGINDIEATELPDYRPVCVPAIVGLVLGALSFLAFLHPVVWAWPILGMGVSIYSLYLLSQSDQMMGRSAAVWGLALSLLFGIAAPARSVAYRWFEQRDARQFGQEWFDALLSGDLYKAHQMSTYSGERKPIDDNLPGLYAASSDLRTALENYLKTPVVATLRNLGSRATARHYETESVLSDSRNDVVEDVYAVSYDEHGKRTTFFVKIQLWRNLRKDAGPRLWRVDNPQGAYKPKGWE